SSSTVPRSPPTPSAGGGASEQPTTTATRAIRKPPATANRRRPIDEPLRRRWGRPATVVPHHRVEEGRGYQSFPSGAPSWGWQARCQVVAAIPTIERTLPSASATWNPPDPLWMVLKLQFCGVALVSIVV